jgi:hypothetical protein
LVSAKTEHLFAGLHLVREHAEAAEGVAMFGHKKLLKEGIRARGVITRLRQQAIRPGLVEWWFFDTRVVFDDGSSIDKDLRMIRQDIDGSYDNFQLLDQFLQPGATVPVRYDHEDHEKLVLDEPALVAELGPKVRSMNADRQGATDEMVARVQAQMKGESAPGSEAAPNGPLAGGSLADILRQAQQDPQGLRERLQAQAGGAAAFVIAPDGGTAPHGHLSGLFSALASGVGDVSWVPRVGRSSRHGRERRSLDRRTLATGEKQAPDRHWIRLRRDRPPDGFAGKQSVRDDS